MIRIKPLSDECREVSKKCVYLLGYQGNNLLCSDWDRSDMEGLDYNGLYEYLYRINTGRDMSFQVTQVEFRQKSLKNLIMEFFADNSGAKLKKWAVF